MIILIIGRMSVYVYYFNDKMLYIGSTFDLKQREKLHRSKLKCGNTTIPFFYIYLREQDLTFDDLKKEIVETAIYEKEPLEILEKMLIKYWKPLCNVNIPGRTWAEWYEDNKEKILEYQSQYREANKEKIAEHKKQYREANKKQITEQQKQWRANNKEKMKEYREANKKQITEQQKQWRTNNKEKMKEYREANKERKAEYNRLYSLKQKELKEMIS